MKILIVEDDKKACDVLKRGLTEAGHIVEAVSDGESCVEYAHDVGYDLIILDIMLPGIDGLEVCRKLRAGPVSPPILMLTGKDTVGDKIKGLNAGADDYLCKPFDFDELEARIKALQRRTLTRGSPVIEAGGISLNTITREVRSNGKKVGLTSTEYRLLEYFMTNPNMVLTRRMIEEHIWNIETALESNAIDVLVGKIRRKMGFDIRACPIQNVYGEGYRFVYEDQA
jgi:DNA-binding response OmpR family regulator